MRWIDIGPEVLKLMRSIHFPRLAGALRHGLVLAAGLCLTPTSWNWTCVLLGMAARLALHLRAPAPGLPPPGRAYYAPLRDGLLLLIWFSAFFGSTAQWREQTVQVDDPAEPIA